jgi:23S rRNA (adenine-N6)-dimethyltransferase
MLKYGRSNPITYSQYFLAKRHIAESLVEKIPRDTLRNHSVIEIGPGTGRLTEFLLATKALTLIEVDYNFWKRLKEKYSRDKYIKVLCGDFMDFQLPSDPYIVVSNLPYFLARNMVNKLLNAQVKPKAMFLIVQEELFRELQSRERGLRISVRLLQRLKRADFVPMPKVESVFIEIVI